MPKPGRPRLMNDTRLIAFHLPGKVARALAAEAKKKNRTVSAHMREILALARPDLPWPKSPEE